MEECQELFYIEDFEAELDLKIKLIGFENGVYDLENGIFRDGISEDYIKYSTKINYYTDFDNFHPQVQEVAAFLHQILPKDEREYAIRLLSSFLDGEIKGQKFHMWSGSGGNGKSKLIELFQKHLVTIPQHSHHHCLQKQELRQKQQIHILQQQKANVLLFYRNLKKEKN